MLTGIHVLLTYTCTYECDHCFLHCCPESSGTFTLAQMRSLFAEIEKIGTIESVYFEGGEPFLYYPVMLQGLKMARRLRLETGVVTNAYWATSPEDAATWLEPLLALEVADLSISGDDFHGNIEKANFARAAAEKLGIPCDTICIAKPGNATSSPLAKGKPVTGGKVRFRGRAVEKLACEAPLRPAAELTSCPYEELESPERVHVDCYGNVHLCQGLSIGNMWEVPLSRLVGSYRAKLHPIAGPLLRGGPAGLASEHGIPLAPGYADECHCCYLVRKTLRSRFPAYLAPSQVYGER